jgi:ribosome-associated translation inhibitor RaiA
MKNISKIIKVNFDKVNPTNTVVNYISKRFKKPKFAKVNIEELDCNISKRSDNGGKKFSVQVVVVVNHTKMYFSEKGNDLYKMIDSILAKVQRKFVTQYNSNFKYNLNYK